MKWVDLLIGEGDEVGDRVLFGRREEGEAWVDSADVVYGREKERSQAQGKINAREQKKKKKEPKARKEKKYIKRRL